MSLIVASSTKFRKREPGTAPVRLIPVPVQPGIRDVCSDLLRESCEPRAPSVSSCLHGEFASCGESLDFARRSDTPYLLGSLLRGIVPSRSQVSEDIGCGLESAFSITGTNNHDESVHRQ
jgi:hypothetical protein